MVKRFPVTVSLANGLSEERTAYLYLPTSYEFEPQKQYPVLYMFDGHNLFFDSDATYGKSWGMADYLDRHHIPLIVAAVECSHSPDHGRLKEYAPFSFSVPEIGMIKGQGQQTMDWFAYSFKPQIDGEYRTLPDRSHTYIAGSSMGGLMSLYALLRYPSVYSRAAALSPSLWIAPDRVQEMIQQIDLTGLLTDPPPVLYMDYGSAEFAGHKNSALSFRQITSVLLEKGIHLTCRIVPNGTHCEASWEQQVPFFLNTLLYDWRP